MTGAEIKTLNTQIRAGREMDDATFYTLAELVKSAIERRRPWRKLIKKDTTKSSSGSTTYATSFAMPADFIMTLPKRTLKLVDSSNNASFKDLDEVPWERWDEYKNQSGYFTIDHLNNLYYISGTNTGTWTHYFFYIATTTTLASGVTWIFPAEFHPAIAFEVAGMEELGIDYDDINARQGNANLARAELIISQAVKWDDQLQRSALRI